MDLNPYSLLPNIPDSGEGRRYCPISEGTTLDEAWPELKKRVDSMIANPRLDSDGCMADCGYLHSACEKWCKGKESETLFKRLINSRVVELYGKCWQTCLTEKLLQRRTEPYYALLELSAAMSVLTDNSDAICYRILSLKIYKTLFNGLNSEPLAVSKMNDPMRSAVAIGHMTILHNVLKRIDVAKRTYRDVENAVEILQRYRVCANLTLATLASLVQSYIISAEENERINTTAQVLLPIVETLKESINGLLTSRLKIHLPPIEIIAVINNLANTNDNNAPRLIDSGVLPQYARVLNPEFGSDCQRESTKGLWTFAFCCPESILTEADCMENLKKLTKDENAEVRNNAAGALWVISNPVLHPTQPQSRLSVSSSDSHLPSRDGSARRPAARQISKTGVHPRMQVAPEDQHVFISYQRTYLKQARFLAARLISEKFKVWLDERDMSGSAMDSMAEAIEKASVVIVLISQKYKDSVNCRSEAHYTFRLQRRVVPVRVEEDYQADGWLGLLIGSQVVIDITGKRNVEEEMIKLLREIRPNPATVKAAPQPTRGPGLHEGIAQWLQLNGLTHLASWFEGMGEAHMAELATLRREAPGEFFRCLRDEHIAFLDRLKLSIALKTAFQLQRLHSENS